MLDASLDIMRCYMLLYYVSLVSCVYTYLKWVQVSLFLSICHAKNQQCVCFDDMHKEALRNARVF